MRFVLPFALSCLILPSAFPQNEFFDDFNRDDGPADGWLTTTGLAEIRGEELLIDAVGSEAWTWIDLEDPFTDDFTFQFDIIFDPSDSAPEVGRHGGVMFCASEKTTRYGAAMNGYTIDWIDRTANPNDKGYRFLKWTNGAQSNLLPDGSAPDQDPGTTWRITITGPSMILEVDGVEKFVAEDEEFRTGFIGFWGYSNGNHIHLDNVAVAEPPDASLTAAPTSGNAPLMVSFDGSSSTTPSGTITSHQWDFGDGDTGTGAQVQHTYAAPGIYEARLRVTDSRGIPDVATVTITALFAGGDVSPWISDDAGTPLTQGGARFEGEGCISVFAGGKEINATEDQFHFVHQAKAGNNVITTQIRNILSWLPPARGGLMFRDSLDPDSAFAMMAAQPTPTGVKAIFLSRRAQGIRAAFRTTPSILVTPPDGWLRLERQGSEFIGSTSTDGQVWTEFYRIALDAPAATMLAGIALTAGDRLEVGQSANILFCNTAFGPSEPPPNPPRNLTATAGDLIVNLAWDAPDPGPEPTGYAVYRDGTKVADVPVADRTFSDGGLANASPYCYVVRATRGALLSNPSNEACATPGAGGQIFHRGDADDNGAIQLTDALRVLGYLFLGGAEPTCVEAFDADDNGQLQLTDALRILGFLFLGGLEPAPPGPPTSPCGPDPEGSPALGCASYTSC